MKYARFLTLETTFERCHHATSMQCSALKIQTAQYFVTCDDFISACVLGLPTSYWKAAIVRHKALVSRLLLQLHTVSFVGQNHAKSNIQPNIWYLCHIPRLQASQYIIHLQNSMFFINLSEKIAPKYKIDCTIFEHVFTRNNRDFLFIYFTLFYFLCIQPTLDFLTTM